MPVLEWLVPLLACPACRGSLSFEPDDGGGRDGLLRHRGGHCAEVYPVIDAIPRLVRGVHRAELVGRKRDWFERSAGRRGVAARWSAAGQGATDAVVSGFDYEWSLFRGTGTPDAKAVFGLYFDLVPDASLAGRTALDAGCGAGRWACEVAARGGRVVAVDLGASVELARANAAGSDRVGCVQGDLRDLPLREEAVDWAYSLGVLHHLDRPDAGLAAVVRSVRPGGRVLLYLYYAFDDRGLLFRVLFRLVDAVRRVTSRSPRIVALAVSMLAGFVVYWPLARASRLLARLGLRRLADALPLSFYRDRSLRTMLNDSLDRFGTRLERRYTRQEMARLMTDAGLTDVAFSPLAPFWHAIGTRGGDALAPPSAPIL